jgi:hypothetical protein
VTQSNPGASSLCGKFYQGVLRGAANLYMVCQLQGMRIRALLREGQTRRTKRGRKAYGPILRVGGSRVAEQRRRGNKASPL